MTRKELQLLLFSVVALIVGVLLTINIASPIHTGIGFGRDLKLVASTEKTERLVQFIDEIKSHQYETELRSVNDNKYIITVSSADTAEVIDKTMNDYRDDIMIEHFGTFGSTTKLVNNQSFISLYFFGIVAVIFIYFTLRFKLVGLISAYKTSLTFVLSIFILQKLGHPFTESLWYVLNLILIITCIDIHQTLRRNEGKLLFDAFVPKRFLIKSASILILHSLIGVLLVFSDTFSSPTEGLFIILFSLVLLILNIGFLFVLKYAKPMIDIKRHPWLVIQESNIVGRFSNPKKALANLLLVAFSIMIILGAFIPKSSLSLPLGERYAKESVLIIPGQGSDSYLEVQAILNSLGIYDKQEKYSVSDQGYTWIYFNSSVSENDLMLSKNVIESKMKITPSYYVAKATEFPLYTFDFILKYAGLVIIAALLLKITFGKRSGVSFATLSVLIPVIFMIVSIIYDLKFSEEMVLLIAFIPSVLYHLIGEDDAQLYTENPRAFYADFIHEFVTIFLIISSFLLIILIIVPINMGIILSKITFYYFIAISLGFVIFTYFYSKIYARKVTEHDDDDIS